MKVRKAGAFVDLAAAGDVLSDHGNVSGGSTTTDLASSGATNGGGSIGSYGTMVQLTDVGSYTERTFTVAAGEAADVKIRGLGNASSRKINITVDGVVVASNVETTGLGAAQGVGVEAETAVLYTITGLAEGSHTIRVTRASGGFSPYIKDLRVISSLAYDMSKSVHSGTLTGNEIVNFSNPPAFGKVRFVFKQDATGGRTITWPSSVTWAGGVPTPSKAANSYESYELITTNGGVTWVGAFLTGADDVTQVELDAVVSGLSAISSNNQTGTTYTLVLADAGKVVELNNAATVTVTVPTNATAAFPIGTVIELWQQGAGQVVVAPAGGVTIRSTEAKLKSYGQYSSLSLRKRATDEWVLVGDLVA